MKIKTCVQENLNAGTYLNIRCYLVCVMFADSIHRRKLYLFFTVSPCATYVQAQPAVLFGCGVTLQIKTCVQENLNAGDYILCSLLLSVRHVCGFNPPQEAIFIFYRQSVCDLCAGSACCAVWVRRNAANKNLRSGKPKRRRLYFMLAVT